MVTYFHSIHDIHTEEELTFIKLTWATDEWEEQIIPKKFLFTKNEYPNLKLTGFPKESAVVRNLNENDLAFKNSKTYIIQDIPTEYIGLPTLKFNSRINTKEIVFYTNVPVIVYSAFLAHYPNPLPDIFENTQQSMSLIQIEAGVNKKQKKLLARRSGMLKIFKKSYLQGYVKIPLKSNGFNAKGIPLIMWFANDPDAGGPVTCGGNEINVSNSNGNYYDSCRASSEYRGSSCTSAFNERMKDTLEEMWSSRSEGIGAWIEVKFKQMFLITKIEYKDKKNPLERNSQIELTFDDSSKQIFDIKNTDELKEFTIEPVKTSTVRIEIKRVYGTVNNGGAFKIIGVKCTNIEEEETNPNKNKLAQVTGVKQANSIPALFRNEEKEMIKCKCMDSISNSKKFQSIVKTVGAKILIYCAETCSMTDYNIYGDLTYSRDSAICRSAFHSQTLPAEGGKVWLIFQNGRSSYKSQIRNGIRSEGKSKSDLSFSFEGYFKQGEIIMEVGSKIDLVNPYTSGWIGAVIMKIQQKDYKNKLIEVAIEGVNQPHLTYNYPDKSKIQPCGEFVKNRDCRSSRRNLNKKVPIRIRFLPEDYYEDGNHLPDNGRIYGFNNRPFGWSKDMRGKIRQFNEASKQELHSYIEFPPSPKSKICKAPNSTCDKVTWSVRVGIGRFFVRLFAGDPENQTKLDLKINDVFLAKNKVIDQNKLKIYEQVLESKDEFLVLSNNCEENCDLANAKINAIEISQYVEKPKTPKATSSEIQLNCGHAFIGGRCDTGPDILHCLIDDPSKEVAGNCGGSNVLMLIPSTYQCKDQIGKYKCMKKIYESNDECRKNCVNNCIRNQCIG